MPATLDRREWLKISGATLASVALSSITAPRLRAQHEVDRSAKRAEPVRILGNENPFGPSQAATVAMMQTMERSCRYPMAETAELLKLIAAKEGCAEENIVLTAGSGDLLEIAALIYGGKQGEIVAAEPGYVQLMRAAELRGSKTVWVPVNKQLEHDLPAMAAKVGPRTALVYVCNPNNPTGTVVDAAALKDFVRTLSRQTTILVDEAYLDLADDYAGRTCVGLIKEGHNVIVARTFSKIYGMAGLRVGYGIMPAALAREFKTYGRGGNSILSVVAASASLQDEAYYTETRAKIVAGRDALVAVVRKLGKEYAVPQGNFVFFRTGLPVNMFIERMKAENVLVGRPFPPLLDWARISIGLPEEMAVCHAALTKILG